MNEFIEKNRRLLRFFCFAAQIIGWMLLLGGAIWFILFASGQSRRIERPDAILYAISSMLFDFMLPGLIALGLTQLIKYLFEIDYKPGCILRNGDRIFYMYAVFLIVNAFLRHGWYVHVWYTEIIEESNFSRLLFMQPFILPTVAKIFILVGLAQILRRILPVIEESKSLV